MAKGHEFASAYPFQKTSAVSNLFLKFPKDGLEQKTVFGKLYLQVGHSTSAVSNLFLKFPKDGLEQKTVFSKLYLQVGHSTSRQLNFYADGIIGEYLF
jgi:hypothetical protein